MMQKETTMNSDRLTTVVVMKTDGTESTFPAQDCKVDAGGKLHVWDCREPGNELFFQTVPGWLDVTVYAYDSDVVLERFSNPQAQKSPLSQHIYDTAVLMARVR
jgi:hypothetical protein